MKLPFADTMQEVLGILKDLWNTGNRILRVAIAVLGFWLFVNMGYAYGGPLKLFILVAFVIVAMKAMKVPQLSKKNWRTWALITLGLVAWMSTGFLQWDTIELKRPWDSVTTWDEESILLPPLSVVAFFPVIAFICMICFSPLLYAAFMVFVGRKGGDGEGAKDSKKAKETSQEEGMAQKAFHFLLTLVGAEVALGGYYYFIKWSEASKELIPVALLIFLALAFIGVGKAGWWRGIVMTVGTLIFFVLTSVALLRKPIYEKVGEEQVQVSTWGKEAKDWIGSLQPKEKPIIISSPADGAPVRMPVSRSRFSEPLTVYLQPGVWSEEIPLGVDDFSIKGLTPGRRIKHYYNDDTEATSRNGYVDTHLAPRCGVNPDGSEKELKVRLYSQYGDTAVITRTEPCLYPTIVLEDRRF